jgi:hypothetical protein
MISVTWPSVTVIFDFDFAVLKLEDGNGVLRRHDLTTVWFEIRLNEKKRCKTIVS